MQKTWKRVEYFLQRARMSESHLVSCLSHDHKKHEFVEIEERREEPIDILQKNIKAVTDNLERKIRNITKAKEDAAEKIENNLKELKMKRKEMIQQYDKMIKDTESQMKQIDIKTNQDLNIMKENLNLLNDINKSAEGVTYKDVVNKLDTVSGIIENVNNHLTGTRTYEYRIYSMNIETRTTRREIVVEIKEEIAEEGLESKRTKRYDEEQTDPARLRGKITIRNLKQ